MLQAHRMQWLWAQAVVIAVTRAMTEQLHRWQAQRKLMADKAGLLEAAVREVVALAVLEAMPRRELPQATEQEMQAVQAQVRAALVAAAAAAAAVQLVAMGQQMAPWQERMGDWAATDFQQADCLQD